jgi:hypothetical protein
MSKDAFYKRQIEDFGGFEVRNISTGTENIVEKGQTSLEPVMDIASLT